MERIIGVEIPGRRYDIHIDAGAFDRLGSLIAPHLAGGPVLVISDDTVAGHYLQRLLDSLAAVGIEAAAVTFPAGEPHKTLSTVDHLWQACATARLDRSGTVIALGGGVPGDIAGFVAATWMRGLRFIQIPTSLLAMVDSSVGGKTGINTAAGKNLVGAFKQPAFVLIDPVLLRTMDAREFAAGLAEVAKYGVIKDPGFFAWQEAHAAALVDRDAEALAHAVAVSCRTKAWYVARDELEGGVRAHLNYGHTFGHALERETGYTHYLHGEAVAIGMGMAAACAAALGLLQDDELGARQRALLAAYGLPIVHTGADDAAIARLADHCRLDKKVRGGSTRFVLPRRLGEVEIVADVDPDQVTRAFRIGCGESG